jgi:cell division protein FtsI (penicillin-binding protein 3)
LRAAGRREKDRARGNSQTRAWSAFFVVAFALLAGRLFQVQVLEHAHYAKQARDSHTRTRVISPLRGNIYDREGRPLAITLSLHSVGADPSLVEDSRRAAPELAPLLRVPAAELEASLRRPGRFVRLLRRADDKLAQRISALNLKGIIVEDDPGRVYPAGPLAAQTIGFVGEDNQGLGGLEAALDKTLGGKPGLERVEVDGRNPRSRRVIPGRRRVLRPMVPGKSVRLTLDLEIQQIAERELAKAVEQFGAAGGAAVVMDPGSGEILALASAPGFDPNRYQSFSPESWVNPAVVKAYEPGSTFKLVMACAAVETGEMANGETIYCQGEKQIGNRLVHCVLHGGSRAHGKLTLAGIVRQSCNIGAATVSLRLGVAKMHHYASLLGFGKRTGLELQGESGGQLAPAGNWREIRLANFGFGQGVSVTPLQLLTAYTTIASGGLRPRPHLVKGDKPVPASAAGGPRRVLRASTARAIREMLEAVVEKGTGKQAQIPGYRVAGKTGTAQKAEPGVGYGCGKSVGSFVGFVPADRPRLACVVVIDEPKGSSYGGVVAAPAFREICRQSLSYLGVAPSAPAGQLVVASQPEHQD